MTPMICKRATQCAYGCCRATGPSGRSQERRWLKRSERQKWKGSLSENF